MKPKEGDLKIWHIPQIPGKGFEMPVRNVVEGKLILDTLAQYDMFQLANNIKGDFSNAAGLMVFEDGEWVDFQDEEGNSLDQMDALPDPETDSKVKALMVIAKDKKISAFLKENDPKALEQVERAITDEMTFREALWSYKIIPSHSAAAEKVVKDRERKERRIGRQLP